MDTFCQGFFRQRRSGAMKYKGYEAIVEFDDEDRLFIGRVMNTRDVIAFDGASVDELEQSFHNAIDEYLEDCQVIGKT